MDLSVTNDKKAKSECRGMSGRTVWQKDVKDIRVSVSHCGQNAYGQHHKVYWITVSLGYGNDITCHVYNTNNEYNDIFNLVGKTHDKAKESVKVANRIIRYVLGKLTSAQLLQMLEASHRVGFQMGVSHQQEQLKKVLGIEEHH